MKKAFILAVFLLLNINNIALAYIDPGFGSMVISAGLGIITAIYFAAYSFFIFLKRKFNQKKDLSKNQFPFVIYSDGKEYYNVFKPITDEFEKRQIPLLFYTSSKDDPFFREEYKYVKGKYIGKNNEAYLYLAFLKADICLMSTPQLDVLQLRRSKLCKYYLHIFHGITTSMDYRLFSLDYYDGVLCDGEFQIPLIRELEKKRNLKNKDLVVVGSTYMDYLAQKLENSDIKKENNNYTVLIAPSWGENSIFQRHGEIIEELSKTDFNLIIRPHPRSNIVEKKMLEKFQNIYKESEKISWDFEIDNLNSMAKADILITDYSTVMFDYAFLFNRPFLYINSDMNRQILDISDIEGPIWRYEIMKKIGRQITNENSKNIVRLIEELKNDPQIYEEIQKAKEIAWFYKGQSAQRAVDFLIEKQKELTLNNN